MTLEHDPSNPPFLLRSVPWWVDDCSTFMNNLLKWYPNVSTQALRVLEFGSGNSTLYFLGKGLQVVSIENNARYIRFISEIASAMGYQVRSVAGADFHPSILESAHLVLIEAQQLDSVETVLGFSWDIIINDGISRDTLLERILLHSHLHHSLVILDNIEFCANWGRLDRSSARPATIQAFRQFLRHPDWSHYIFEQPEGRNGHSIADKWGKETPHRWLSGVCWHRSHLFNELMVSHLGFPVVNLEGIENQDLQHLATRCHFDPRSNRWNQPRFPSSLNLPFHREYE